MIKTVETNVLVLVGHCFVRWIWGIYGFNSEVVKIEYICLCIKFAMSMEPNNVKNLVSTDCKKKVLGKHDRIMIVQFKPQIKLGSTPMKDIKDTMSILECFDVLMYDRTSNCLDNNSWHHNLFIKKGRVIEFLQVKFSSFLKHTVKRTKLNMFEDSHWCTQQNLPPPEYWGWKRVDQIYVPHWVNLGEAAIAVQESRGDANELMSKGDCERD